MINGLDEILIPMLPLLVSSLISIFIFDIQNLLAEKLGGGLVSRTVQFIISKLSCRWCIGLWLTLLLTGNIWMALTTSFFYTLIEKNI